MTEPVNDWEATRWSLLARLKDWDDQQSWREFFEAYWRLIYAVAVKSGLTNDEAQDVVQDTVISVAKSIHNFKCDPAAGSFKAWLLKLTRWRILNQIKKRLPSAASHEPSDSEGSNASTSTVDSLPDPASLEINAAWEREWEKNLAETAKDRVRLQVSARQFQIFELYVVQQWPVREIARMLRVSAGQVYLAKHRVGRLLEKEIRRLKSHC